MNTTLVKAKNNNTNFLSMTYIIGFRQKNKVWETATQIYTNKV